MKFNNPFKKNIVPQEKKAYALGTSESLGDFLLFGEGYATKAYTAAAALSLYRRSTAVSVPVNRIAQAIAGMKIVLRNNDGSTIDNHPSLELIRKPSPYYTKSLFLEMLAKNYLVTGESQIVAIGGINRPPIELQPISPDKITVTEGSGGLPGQIQIAGMTMNGDYLPLRKGNDVRYVRDEFTEIHMTRSFKTRNNSLLRGESVLLSASSEVRQQILGGEHNVSLLEKGGRVSLVFHFNEDMSIDDFETAKERVRSQYGGANNAGEIGVTAGDGSLEIKEVGQNARDMDFANLQRMAKVAVANQYSYPLVLLDTEAATFDNYTTAKEALYDDAAIPVAEVLLNGLSEFLLPRYGLDPSQVSFGVDIDVIPSLAMRRNKELKLRREIGIESVNELRAMLPNRDAVDEGDKIYIGANMVAIDEEPMLDLPSNPGIDANE